MCGVCLMDSVPGSYLPLCLLGILIISWRISPQGSGTKALPLSLLQNSLDGFCQSSVRVGEVVSRIYFEVKNELHMELAVTVGTYEKLAETFGADSTLTIFRKQVNAVRK